MRYIAVQPIKHDGKRVEPGEPVSMTEQQAAPLLAGGVIEADRKVGEKAAAEKAAAEKAAAEKAAAEKAAADQAAAGKAATPAKGD